MNYGENVYMGNWFVNVSNDGKRRRKGGGWEKLFANDSACKTSRKQGIKLENMT